MNRIQQVFENKKAFIPFITAGDPDLSVTEALVPAMAEAGADLIELGIPFSDPVAEGIVIQEADLRALASGTTTDKDISIELEPSEIQRHLHILAEYPVEIFILICKYLVDLLRIFKSCRTKFFARHIVSLTGVIHDNSHRIDT